MTPLEKSQNHYISVAKASKREEQVQAVSNSLGRWERLLENNNDLDVWRAIDWKEDVKSSDEQFKDYLECSFNPLTDVRINPDMFTSYVLIPLLEEPITPLEVEQVKKLKYDKASGPDGLSPGILKILPGLWIVLLAHIFNLIFFAKVYPKEWSRDKLCTIFKKGNKNNVRNYRGISIISSMAKLYDIVLCSRLKIWFKPFREQTGGQKRGCLEHIVSLRLLCDMVRRNRKLKLFLHLLTFHRNMTGYQEMFYSEYCNV